MNGGRAPLTTNDHFVADVWAQLEDLRNPKRQPVDHPVRVEMEAATRAAKKTARVIDLRDHFEKRKRAYGLG